VEKDARRGSQVWLLFGADSFAFTANPHRTAHTTVPMNSIVHHFPALLLLINAILVEF
jgi:hypothetical protein